MTNTINAVQSSAVMRLNDDCLGTICGFVGWYECPGAMGVCKAWNRVFTPYNALKYSDKMVIEGLARTCPPRNRPNVYHQGVRYDMEHANLRTSRAYQLIAAAEHNTFTSLDLSLGAPEHITAAIGLVKTQKLHALTDLHLPYVPSTEILRALQEGCPQLRSLSTSLTPMTVNMNAEAMCEALNACENLTETTVYSVTSDDDLQKLQKLNSLTRLQPKIGLTTTPSGLRHLADGYPSLRMLGLSGGSAGEQPVLLARPWIQRLVELESLAFRLLGLSLSNLTKVESACVATQFLSKASKLQALEVACSDLDPDCVKQLPKCPSLTDLDISYMNEGITEATIQTVGQCAKLRFLEIAIPNEVDLGKALKHLDGHKALEDLTLERWDLKHSPNPELLEKASEQLASCVKTMPALRVLELPGPLHSFVVQKLPHHNVYIRRGLPREKYKLLPAPGMEKTESKSST